MTTRNIILLIGGLFLVTLLFFVYIAEGDEGWNWTETYKEDDINPYGSHVAYELLVDFFADENFQKIDQKLETGLPDSTSHVNYVFIGPNLLMDSLDIEKLLQFVGKGNTAFISSLAVPYDLMFHIYFQECNYVPWDDYFVNYGEKANLNLVHPNLVDSTGFGIKYIYNYNVDDRHRWKYIDDSYFCDEDYSFVKLGTMNDTLANFAMINHGKGQFYFHTTPLAFSNLSLLERNNLPYFYKSFSHLKKGPIYWDANNRTIESFNRRNNRVTGNDPNRTLNNEGPLKYILSQKSFSWAWYLSLFTGLLYLIFRAKRRQRIIPVAAANNNTSMEFISTIGRLYFLKNDHKKLCLQKMKLFLSYVRNRYSIPTKVIDEAFVYRLSNKSEIPESLINKIFKYYNNIKSSSFISEQTMVEFHVLTDEFYKKCK